MAGALAVAEEKLERYFLNMSGMSTVESPEGEKEQVYYFGDDPKGWNFRTEIRGTLADQMRGCQPTTILGILIQQSQHPETERLVAMEDLAGMAGRTVSATEAIVDYLAAEDLATTVTEDGVERAVGFAYYTPKNTTALPVATDRP